LKKEDQSQLVSRPFQSFLIRKPTCVEIKEAGASHAGKSVLVIKYLQFSSFDMTVGDACDEKQFWSDNGYSRFIVKCVRSKKRPGHSVRLKMVMTCEWGNCRNGGGSG
jgi:hypothetical protein